MDDTHEARYIRNMAQGNGFSRIHWHVRILGLTHCGTRRVEHLYRPSGYQLIRPSEGGIRGVGNTYLDIIIPALGLSDGISPPRMIQIFIRCHHHVGYRDSRKRRKEREAKRKKGGGAGGDVLLIHKGRDMSIGLLRALEQLVAREAEQHLRVD